MPQTLSGWILFVDCVVVGSSAAIALPPGDIATELKTARSFVYRVRCTR